MAAYLGSKISSLTVDLDQSAVGQHPTFDETVRGYAAPGQLASADDTPGDTHVVVELQTRQTAGDHRLNSAGLSLSTVPSSMRAVLPVARACRPTRIFNRAFGHTWSMNSSVGMTRTSARGSR